MFNNYNRSQQHDNESTFLGTSRSSAAKLIGQATSTPLTRSPTMPGTARLNSTLQSQRYALSTTEGHVSTISNGRSPNNRSCLPTSNRSSTGLFSDLNSPGLTSRIVQYDMSARTENLTPTHNRRYNNPGMFPVVHLNRRSYAKSVPLKSSVVTVRIAPPEDLSMYSTLNHSVELNNRQSALTENCESTESSTRSVLDALRSISGKRLNAEIQSDTIDNGSANKKNKRVDSAIPLSISASNGVCNNYSTGKRPREASPPLLTTEKVGKKQLCSVDPLQASLSSSRLLQKRIELGMKRKAEEEANAQEGRLPECPLPSSTQQKRVNTGTQTMALEQQEHVMIPSRKALELKQICEGTGQPQTEKRDQAVSTEEQEDTLSESALPYPVIASVQIFDDKRLEVIRKNKLAAMLGAITGETPKLISLASLNKRSSDSTDASEPVEPVTSQPISILISPDKPRSSNTKRVSFGNVTVTETTSSINVPVSTPVLINTTAPTSPTLITAAASATEAANVATSTLASNNSTTFNFSPPPKASSTLVIPSGTLDKPSASTLQFAASSTNLTAPVAREITSQPPSLTSSGSIVFCGKENNSSPSSKLNQFGSTVNEIVTTSTTAPPTFNFSAGLKAVNAFTLPTTSTNSGGFGGLSAVATSTTTNTFGNSSIASPMPNFGDTAVRPVQPITFGTTTLPVNSTTATSSLTTNANTLIAASTTNSVLLGIPSNSTAPAAGTSAFTFGTPAPDTPVAMVAKFGSSSNTTDSVAFGLGTTTTGTVTSNGNLFTAAAVTTAAPPYMSAVYGSGINTVAAPVSGFASSAPSFQTGQMFGVTSTAVAPTTTAATFGSGTTFGNSAVSTTVTAPNVMLAARTAPAFGATITNSAKPASSGFSFGTTATAGAGNTATAPSAFGGGGNNSISATPIETSTNIFGTAIAKVNTSAAAGSQFAFNTGNSAFGNNVTAGSVASPPTAGVFSFGATAGTTASTASSISVFGIPTATAARSTFGPAASVVAKGNSNAGFGAIASPFGAPTKTAPPAFGFGGNTSSTGFGAINNINAHAAAPTTYGAPNAPFGSMVPAETSSTFGSSGGGFGGNAVVPQQTSLFKFGGGGNTGGNTATIAPTPASNSGNTAGIFAFGGANVTQPAAPPKSGGFNFGGASTLDTSSATMGGGIGVVKPSTGGFNFGSTDNKQATGGFSLSSGGAGNNTTPVMFGAGLTNGGNNGVALEMFGNPQPRPTSTFGSGTSGVIALSGAFGGGSPSTASAAGGGMFSIGSGGGTSSAGRSRTTLRPKRRT